LFVLEFSFPQSNFNDPFQFEGGHYRVWYWLTKVVLFTFQAALKY